MKPPRQKSKAQKALEMPAASVAAGCELALRPSSQALKQLRRARDSKAQCEQKKSIQASLQDIEPSHLSEMVPTLAGMQVMMERPSVLRIELLTWPDCLVLTD